MITDQVERRTVDPGELKSGIQLRTGPHVVVLTVRGFRSRPSAVGKYGFAIEVQLHAAGGTPLANERVRIHDPDTGEPVGEPCVTDENGVLRARVPAEKEYQIHLDVDAPEEHADAVGEHEHPLAAHLPHPDEHAVLFVAFLDAKGTPLRSEAVKMTDADGKAQELKTDERGNIDLVVEHGVFTMEVHEASFIAHSVMSGDLTGEDAPYRFLVP